MLFIYLFIYLNGPKTLNVYNIYIQGVEVTSDIHIILMFLHIHKINIF